MSIKIVTDSGANMTAGNLGSCQLEVAALQRGRCRPARERAIFFIKTSCQLIQKIRIKQNSIIHIIAKQLSGF